MERKSKHPDVSPQEFYKKILETHRDTLSDDEMGVLLALHENHTKEAAAAEMGISVEELDKIISPFLPEPKQERLTRDGKPYLKHLSGAAFTAILNDYPELDDDERKIIGAMVGARNQTVAALSLEMSYSDFVKRYIAIRRKHGF